MDIEASGVVAVKILSIGNFGTGWDGSICDEEHIAGALEELGHTVFRQQREDLRDEANKFLYIGDTTLDIDFVLIAQWDSYPDLNWLKVPKVYWAFDYQADGQEWHERLINESDLYLSKRIADSKYPNWQWLSQDFAPMFLDKHSEPVIQSAEECTCDNYMGHKPFCKAKDTYPQTVKDIDVLFTGTYLPWATKRNQTLKAVDEKFNLHIYSVNPAEWMSAGFKHVNGPVMDDALPELIARAKINLSIDHTLEAGYWSDRNAQIMACGGFVLTRYVPLMEAVFHSFIGYYYDIDTCLRCVEYWLEADEDRENLAAYGHEYAQEHLKARERVDDLINIVQGIL